MGIPLTNTQHLHAGYVPISRWHFQEKIKYSLKNLRNLDISDDILMDFK
jgi:hypothetical protein